MLEYQGHSEIMERLTRMETLEEERRKQREEYVTEHRLQHAEIRDNLKEIRATLVGLANNHNGQALRERAVWASGGISLTTIIGAIGRMSGWW